MNTSDNRVAVYNVLKGLLVAGGPIAVLLTTVFHINNDTVQLIIQIASSLLSIVGLVWLGISGTDANVARHAADVRGVQVHVDTNVAPDSVVEEARDRNVPDVVPMIGGPRHDINKN